MAGQMKLAVLKAPRQGGAGRKRKPVENLHGLLDALDETCADTEGDKITVRDILDAVGRRSYGPLLAAIGIVAISPLSLIPGSTWLFALVTLLIAGQMAIGRKAPWLPSGFQNIETPKKAMASFIEKARPWAKRVDSVLKPRLTFLDAPPFVNIVALFCMAAALITIPLGFIPFAPAAPSLAILLFGLGMTARDGLVLLLGSLAMAASIWMVTLVPWPF